MKLQIFQADAFAANLFKGNPAAVVPLKEWLPDQILQQIAIENNLSETAFFIPEDDHLIFVGSPQNLKWSFAAMQH